MTRIYTHLELDREVSSIAGYYVPRKEERLKHAGREVLAVVGCSVVDSSCCGVGNWNYALVPGYVVRWQHEKNDNGLPVSEVEPISDPAVKEEISRLLKKDESAATVEFW